MITACNYIIRSNTQKYMNSSAQCPRRQKSGEEDHSRHQPPATGHSDKKPKESPGSTAPSSAPPEKFIQTTFLHNDRSDDDKIFSEEVKEVFAEVRQRLNTHLRLTVDNEDVSCYSKYDSLCIILFEISSETDSSLPFAMMEQLRVSVHTDYCKLYPSCWHI